MGKQGLDMTVEVVEAHIKGLISEGKLHYSSASGGKSGSPATYNIGPNKVAAPTHRN